MGCTVSAPHHFLHARGHRSIDPRSEGSLTSKTHPRPTDVDVRQFYNIPQRLLLTRCDIGQVMSIDMLPDDILLEIFDFFVRETYRTEVWETLVHVCRHHQENVNHLIWS